MNILFDSDVLIEYLRMNSTVIEKLESLALSDAVLAITPVTLAEIFGGLRSNERRKAEKAFSAFQCLSLGPEIGKRAGEYLRSYRKSHGLELADALIAASAAVHRFALCSFNWKHYPMSEIQRFRIVIGGILEKRRRSSESYADILTHLMAGGKMNDAQLIDEIISIYAAAHEPTATILMYLLYLLATHTDVHQKCRSELRESLGGGDPNLENLKKLPYNLSVVKEALRLYPSVWAFTRQALREDQVGSYRIRKGDHLVFSPYFIHRHPDYWPAPEEFRPERFAADPSPSFHEFSYLPFGGGPKYCVGSEFAMLILQTVTAMVIREHRLQLQEGFRFEIEAVTTLRPKNGFWVRVAEA